MEQNNEKAILEAAERLFLERGYALTSTADIARAAGCTTALIHYYFRTKIKLFEHVFRKKIQHFVQGFMFIEAPNLDFETRIGRVVETHFEFIRSNPRLPFLLITEFATNPAAVDSLKSEVTIQVSTLIDMAQREIDGRVEKGEIRAVSAMDLLFTIASLNVMTFLAMPVLRHIEMFDEEQFLEERKKEIAQTVLNSLKIR